MTVSPGEMGKAGAVLGYVREGRGREGVVLGYVGEGRGREGVVLGNG